MGDWILKASAALALPLFLCMAWVSHQEAAEFISHGETPLASSWTKVGETRNGLDRNPWNTVPKHEVDIRFTTRAGEEVTIRKTIPDDVWKKRDSPGGLGLVYLVTNPKRTRLSTEQDQCLLLAALGLVASAFLFWVSRLTGKAEAERPSGAQARA
jgi:hypothetical protein